MTEAEALSKMIAPSMKREGKPHGGVIQILVTSSCTLSCTNCTQMSQIKRKHWEMTLEQFESACKSLDSYWGTVGVFGGCPNVCRNFEGYCEILQKYVPFDRRGLWTNDLVGKGAICQKTFNPGVSNLNCHLNERAYAEMKRDWPESMPFGLKEDSRHSPVFVAMKDVVKKECPMCEGGSEEFYNTPGEERDAPCSMCHGKGRVVDEERIWELISECPINRHWSAMLCVFRGELRAFFCEIAGSQAMLHQDDPTYPDTGMPLFPDEPTTPRWWQYGMTEFAGQVRHHCFDCGIPLNGYGELAQAKDGVEQCSETHKDVYKPKTKGRQVEVVTDLVQLDLGRLTDMTKYVQNAKLR